MYQFHVAPVAKLPPVIPRVEDEPLHIGVVPVAEVADVDNVFTVTIVFTHVVVLQVPEANT